MIRGRSARYCSLNQGMHLQDVALMIEEYVPDKQLMPVQEHPHDIFISLIPYKSVRSMQVIIGLHAEAPLVEEYVPGEQQMPSI